MHHFVDESDIHMIELDHVVIAALSLDEGVGWLEQRLRVRADPGGQHTGFGTHNAVLRAGDDVYLEVIAPDPAQPEPGRPRLFGLDEPATRALLAGGPRLLHWVVRTRELEAERRKLAAVAGVAPEELGEATPMRRGGLSWTLTIPASGGRPPAGMPSIIDWEGAPHPCSRLPDRGVVLERLELAAPAPTIAALADLGRDRRVAFVEAAAPRWTARLRTAAGSATLG